MIIKIDAEKAASLLAFQDTYIYFCTLRKGELTPENVRDFLDNNTPLPPIISVKEGFHEDNMRYFYEKQHDYYFENLTNLQL